jgi:hypothetical protein
MDENKKFDFRMLELFYLRHRRLTLGIAVGIIGMAFVVVLGLISLLVFNLNKGFKDIPIVVGSELKDAHRVVGDNQDLILEDNKPSIYKSKIENLKQSEGKILWFSLYNKEDKLMALTPVLDSSKDLKVTFSNSTTFKSATLLSPYFSFLSENRKIQLLGLLEEALDLNNYAKTHTLQESITNKVYFDWLSGQAKRQEIQDLIRIELDSKNFKNVPAVVPKNRNYKTQLNLDAYGQTRDLSNKWGLDIVSNNKDPKILNRSNIYYSLRAVPTNSYNDYKDKYSNNSPIGADSYSLIDNSLIPLNLKQTLGSDDIDTLDSFGLNEPFKNTLGEYKLIPFQSFEDIKNNFKELEKQVGFNNFSQNVAPKNLDMCDKKEYNFIIDCYVSGLSTDNQILRELWAPQLKNPISFIDYKNSAPQVAFLNNLKNPFALTGLIEIRNLQDRYLFSDSGVEIAYNGAFKPTIVEKKLILTKKNLEVAIAITPNTTPDTVFCVNNQDIISLDNNSYYVTIFNSEIAFIKSNDRYLKGDASNKEATPALIRTTVDLAKGYKNCFRDDRYSSNFLDRRVNIRAINSEAKEFSESELQELYKLVKEIQFTNR